MITINLIFRYIFRHMVTSTLLVLAAFGGLLGILGTADELSRRIKHNYTVAEAVKYKLMTLPFELYQYSLLMLALASLISIAGLSKSSELVIIRQISGSNKKLVGLITMPILTIAVAFFCIGEFWAPTWKNTAEERKAFLRGNAVSTEDTQYFLADNWIIEASYVHPQTGELTQPTFYQFSNNQLSTLITADTARAENSYWKLTNGLITAEGKALNQTYAEDRLLTIQGFNPYIAKTLSNFKEALPLHEFMKNTAIAKVNGSYSSEQGSTLWQRIFYPLYAFALVLIAISFSMVSYRNKSIGDTAFKGLAAAFVTLTLLDIATGILAVYKFPGLVATLLPYLLCLTITAKLAQAKL